MSQQLAVIDIPENFYEVRELVRTVYLCIENKEYRIEISHPYTNPKTPYVAKSFIKSEIYNDKPGEPHIKLEAFLVDDRMPWVAERSPEEALNTAIRFLDERHRK
jgi:hypothetical protein